MPNVKDSLAVGLEHTASYEVAADMTPAHLPVAVLSTPSMILLVEQTCLAAAQAHLDEGETTVGTHVCVSHTGAVAVGQTVRVSCALTSRERRRLTFDVEVAGPDGAISTGTHERFVVDASRFGGA
jgi:fluoroacetyl-CoA thioesterase